VSIEVNMGVGIGVFCPFVVMFIETRFISGNELDFQDGSILGADDWDGEPGAWEVATDKWVAG
jgi:hypothetical protein